MSPCELLAAAQAGNRRAIKALLFPLRYGMHRVGDQLVPYTQDEIDAYARRLGIEQ